MFEILPSPGTEQKKWSAMEKRIAILTPFVSAIHIDAVDGKFAPNTTFTDPKPFRKYTKEFLFEIHLMVEEPINHLQAWAAAGFRRFIGQIEQMSDQEEFVAQGQLLGEVGLAIDGKTPLDALKVPLSDLDTVLIMTINAGFSGQAFMPEHLEKVRKIREQNEFIPIEVDGGMNLETIVQAKDAGATRFVCTSAIFGQPDPHKAFLDLQEAINR